MKVVTGKIERLAPTADGGYNGSHGYVYTFDMTVRCAEGTVSGEIGTKSEKYPLNLGDSITVEAKQTEHGPRLTKINPQYSGGGQQRSSGGGNSRNDENVDRSVAMSYAKDLVVAGVVQPAELFSAAQDILNWVVDKQPDPQGGDPNPEYSDNPPEPEGDIPF